MSTGTNKERIEQNNLKLEDIKTQIQNLPEAGGAAGGVKTYSSYEEMVADTSIKDGTVCVIEIYKESSGNLYDMGVGKKVKIPTTITMSKLIMAPSYSSTYASDDDNDRLRFKKGALTTALTIEVVLNGSIAHSIKYTYNTDLGAYTTTTISEPMEIEFTNYIRQKSFKAELLNAISSIEVLSSVNYIENIYKYENNEFILLDTHNTTIAHITNNVDNMPEGKFDGEFVLAHRGDTTTSIEPNTPYPVITFKEKINKSEITEGTYTYNHMQYDSVNGSIEQKITIEVGSNSIKATCRWYTDGEILAGDLATEFFTSIGLENVDVEYTLNTETNEYEIQNQTSWLFGNGEEVSLPTGYSFKLKPLNIPTNDWQDTFKILCNGVLALYGIYQFNQTAYQYSRVNYGFNAKTGDVLEGKVAFSDGMLTGTMPNNGALNYNPSTSVQTIPAGYTSGGTISVVDASIDENIIPENIKSGVTILGVTGTYTGESSEMPEIDSITFTGGTSFEEGTNEVKAGATLGTFIVTGGTAPYSYSFGVDTNGTASKDNDKFALSGNSLLVGSAALTYSNRPTDGVYQTRVVVTDSNSKTKTIDLEIMVTRGGHGGGGDKGDGIE